MHETDWMRAIKKALRTKKAKSNKLITIDVFMPERGRIVKVSIFSYKYGKVPQDADLVIDCRRMQNPRLLPETDAKKRQRVLNNPMSLDMIQEGLDHLTNGGNHVAYGCIYGRHRSYAVAWELVRWLNYRSSVNQA